jgi:hypothetical protein
VTFLPKATTMRLLWELSRLLSLLTPVMSCYLFERPWLSGLVIWPSRFGLDAFGLDAFGTLESRFSASD